MLSMNKKIISKTQIDQRLGCNDWLDVISYAMSTEQLARNSQTTQVDFDTDNKNSIRSNKVDINVLMDKVRAEKKKEKKENLIFFSLISSVILVTAVIASF